MTLVIVNQHRDDTLGGSELQCDLIATGLHARGHTLAYVAPGSTRPAGVVAGGYELVPTANTAAAIADAVLARRPEAVYWRYNLNHFRPVARRLAREGVPLVFACSHENDVIPGSVKVRPGLKGFITTGLQRLRSNWHYRGFRDVAALTVNNRDLLGRAPVRRQHYVANGMTAAAEPFQWPRPYCAWVANIKSAKRPEAAVRLAADLQSLGVDLVMIGAMQSERYRWLADANRRPPNCHYLGAQSVEAVNGVLAGSLIHVHTCRPEGFSNVFIQAWLQGRPSVSLGCDPGGCIAREGLGFDAGDDFDRFVEATRALIADPDERQRLGSRARTFAASHFSVDRLVEQVETILAEAAQASRP